MSNENYVSRVCPNCQGQLLYQESIDSYFCEACNVYFASSEFEKPEKNLFTGKFKSLVCKMCGRTTIVQNQFDYDVCPFCYSNLIDIKDGVTQFAPKFMFGFKETREEFAKNFPKRAIQAGMPKETLAEIKLESLKGIYVPVYMYSIKNDTKVFLNTRDFGGKVKADDYYYSIISYDDTLDILVDTTRLLGNEILRKIADFNFKKIDMFFPDRIKDFFLVIPNYGGEIAGQELKRLIKEMGEKEASEKYLEESETIKELKVFNDIKILTRKLILLPIWFLETNLGEGNHYLFVNGQTDRMACDIDLGIPEKKSLFGKEKKINFQISNWDMDDRKLIDCKSRLEYMNELKKYEVNKNDRSAEIRKVR